MHNKSTGFGQLRRQWHHAAVYDAMQFALQGVMLTGCCTTAMQAVAVQGAHKHYQLQQADLTCSSLDELTVYNIRRLFALKVKE